MWDPLKIDSRNHHDVYFCRYETRVDYIYCNENVRKEWLPVAVEHFDVVSFTNLLAASGLVKLTNFDGEISDHKAVIAILIKKSGK